MNALIGSRRNTGPCPAFKFFALFALGTSCACANTYPVTNTLGSGAGIPANRHVITAIATDPDNNTSEFSACGTQDTIFSDGADLDDNLTV